MRFNVLSRILCNKIFTKKEYDNDHKIKHEQFGSLAWI